MLCTSKKLIPRLCLTSVSAGAPRLFGHTRAPDDGSSCRLECIHVGVLQTRRVAEVFPEDLSGEMLLTRLLMDLWCLPVRSEMPLFTSLAHVRELNGDAVRRLGPMGHLKESILMLCFSFRIYLNYKSLYTAYFTNDQLLLVKYAAKREVKQSRCIFNSWFSFIFLYVSDYISHYILLRWRM